MRTGLIACALLLPALASGADLQRLVEKAGRQTASRLAANARKAEQAGAGGTARLLYERALALDPDQVVARARLGYRRVAGAWRRDDDGAKEVAARRDAKGVPGKEYRDATRAHDANWGRSAAGRWAQIASPVGARGTALAAASPRLSQARG